MRRNVKKNVAVSIGLVCMLFLLFTACGKESNSVSDVVSQALAEETEGPSDAINSEQLIYNLLKYNNSLSYKRQASAQESQNDKEVKETNEKESDINQPTPESLVAAYASVAGTATDEDYRQGLSCGLDSNAVKVGILLDKFLSRVDKTDRNSAESSSNLSAVESEILTSPEFKEQLEKVISDPESFKVDGDKVADYVMDLFGDAVTSCSDQKELENTVRYYTLEVKRCGFLSEDDKENLYASFAVAVYSYNFWANK